MRVRIVSWETRMPGDTNIRLQSLREYERIHLNDIADTAQREMEIIKELYNTSKIERAKKYADTIAERVELKDPMLDITEKTQVSTYLRRKYRECGVSEGALNHITNHLSEEYKNKAFQRETVELGNGLVQESNGYENVADSQLKKPVKQMDNLELQETDDMLSEKEKKLKAELARVRDIKEMVYETAGERHFSVPSQKETVISTPKPGEQDNPFAEALIDLGNCLVEIGYKAREFPPNPQDAKRYAQAVKTYIDYTRPLTDLKFTKGTRGWLKAGADYDVSGKHASAVKNAVVTPSGVKRPLTREQVGDKIELICNQAIDIINSEYLLESLEDWHDKYIEPFVGQRKVDLHGKLSERA